MSTPRRKHLITPLISRPTGLGLLARNPEIDDLRDLSELMLDAYRGTIDSSGDETLADTERELRTFFDGGYGEPLLECSFIAEHDTIPVGASLITLYYEGSPFLAFTFTEPEWKGRGIAGNLVQLSMNALAARGYETLALVVTEGNEPAERLYSKLGFIEEPS